MKVLWDHGPPYLILCYLSRTKQIPGPSWLPCDLILLESSELHSMWLTEPILYALLDLANLPGAILLPSKHGFLECVSFAPLPRMCFSCSFPSMSQYRNPKPYTCDTQLPGQVHHVNVTQLYAGWAAGVSSIPFRGAQNSRKSCSGW